MRLVAADNGQAFPVSIHRIHDNQDLLKKAQELVTLTIRMFVIGSGLGKASLDMSAERPVISDQIGDVGARCQ